MTPKFNFIYTQALTGAGLSIDQAHLYQILLQHGPKLAGRIPRYLDISRPHAYKLLMDLVEMGIVIKDEQPGKPARYAAAHPFSVQELIRHKRQQIEVSNQSLQGIMGSLISDYTQSSKLPGIRIIPEIDGLKALYKDILQERSDISLIRSIRDDESPELMSTVLEQIEKQVSLNINVRIIGPLPTDTILQNLRLRDQKRLITRRILPREKFSLPAQIIIYKNKIGITAYESLMITTIIENEAISSSLKAMFEVIWHVAENPLYET